MKGTVSIVAITCMIVITMTFMINLETKNKQRIGSIICYTDQDKEYYRNSYAPISEGNGMFYIDNTTSISGNCVVIYKQGK